jgi:hypothetical protein
MPGVLRKEAEHSLDLNEKARPVKQRLRRFAQDRKEAIRVEVTRLLAAGFIREVTHPEWLANPVLVKKEKWRMENVYRRYRKTANGECRGNHVHKVQ